MEVYSYAVVGAMVVTALLFPAHAVSTGGSVTDRVAATETPTDTPAETRLPASPPAPTSTSTDAQTSTSTRAAIHAPTATPTPNGVPTSSQIATRTAASTEDGVSAEHADDDFDGVPDTCERNRLETDPTDPDTDGDGLVDGWEANHSEADPLRRDVFVEIDRAENGSAWLSEEDVERIERSYESAPVENPDGTTGVDIHIEQDEVIETPNESIDMLNLWQLKRDHQSVGEGYRYTVLVDDVSFRGSSSYSGFAAPWFQAAAIDYYRSSAPSVFVHEMGHLLGLNEYVYDGIDSRRVSFENYSSVMNYNAPETYMNYSVGSGEFDDWQYLEDRGFVPVIVPRETPDECD